MLAYTLAILGDVAYYLVLTWAAAEAGGAGWSGLILAAGSVPRLLLLLVGGLLADRIDPRRIAIWTDTARSVTLIAASALTALLGVLPWWLLAVAVIFGIVDACFIPAVGAMPARLVAAEDLTRLQAWRLSGLRIGNAVGPLLGAVLLAAGGTAAFAVLAVLFLGSVLLLRGIRPRTASTTDDAPQPLASGSGWQTVRRLRIAPLVIGTALSELPFSGPVGVAMVLLAQERGWHPGLAGAMLTAFSLGGLAVSLLMSTLPAVGGRLTVLGSVAATAMLLLLFGMAADAVPAVLRSTGLGVASGVTQVICQGQVQRSAPVAMLGRVTAVLTLLTLGLSPLAYAGVGVVADLAGLPVFFAVAAGVILLSGLLLATARFGPPRAITPIAA
ncbi:MFS transporter [Microbacterium sp. 69-10]|uniref:MFS transporter n=1 Tax=Microbacterium sp. 69-10 TaxID=1895783 RepID=UPI0025F135C1|nr:MFS transporter [Microbacterium sp. 69-10]